MGFNSGFKGLTLHHIPEELKPSALFFRDVQVHIYSSML